MPPCASRSEELPTLSGPPTEMAAQEPLSSGSRLRVTAPNCALREQATTFRGFRADAIVFDTIECPLASLAELDVYRGRRGRTRGGALIGGLVSVSETVLVTAFSAGCDFECDVEAELVGGILIFGGLPVGLLGAGIGALTSGTLDSTQRRRAVPASPSAANI